MAAAIWNEEHLREHLKAKMNEQRDRYLLRGQRRRYPTVTATIARIEGLACGQAYTILRRFVGQYRGQIYPPPLRGAIKAEPEEVIALLQHYGWPTPYLDLTDDLDVAFFFAHDGYRPEEGEALMFVVDTAFVNGNHVIVSHDEVVNPTLNIRWSRQNGHAIRPRNWINMGEVKEFDLSKQPYIMEYTFQPSEKQILRSIKKRPHYYADNPAVKRQLKFLIEGIAEMCDFRSLTPELQSFPY